MATWPDWEHQLGERFWREEEKKEENFCLIENRDGVKYTAKDMMGYKWSNVKWKNALSCYCKYSNVRFDKAEI